MTPSTSYSQQTSSGPVSSFYGPGAFYGWELLALSCIIWNGFRREPERVGGSRNAPDHVPLMPLQQDPGMARNPELDEHLQERFRVKWSPLGKIVEAMTEFDANFFGVLLFPTVACLDLIRRLCQPKFDIEYTGSYNTLTAITSVLWSNWTICYLLRISLSFSPHSRWKKRLVMMLFRTTTTLVLLPNFYIHYRIARTSDPGLRFHEHFAWYLYTALSPEIQVKRLDWHSKLNARQLGFVLSLVPNSIIVLYCTWTIVLEAYKADKSQLCFLPALHSSLSFVTWIYRTWFQWNFILDYLLEKFGDDKSQFSGQSWSDVLRDCWRYSFVRAPATGYSILDLDQMVPLLIGLVSVSVRVMQVVDSRSRYV